MQLQHAAVLAAGHSVLRLGIDRPWWSPSGCLLDMRPHKYSVDRWGSAAKISLISSRRPDLNGSRFF
jgi:hypothetical protein